MNRQSLRAESVLAAAAAVVGVIGIVSALTPEFANRYDVIARYAKAVKRSRAAEVATVVAMRRDLAALWERSNASKEQLLRQLQDWCGRAEASGIAALAEFSQRLRSYA